jgi:Zn-dependent protease
LFLAEPPRTQFDLHFEIFGTHVRVHPLFWLVAGILGLMGGQNSDNPGALILIWVVTLFVSILVHEMGHIVAMRVFGERGRVVLYSFGGLAIPDVSPFSFGYGRGRSPKEQIIISLAGPVAGFLLAAIVIGLVYVGGGSMRFGVYYVIPVWDVMGVNNEYLRELVNDMLWVNIFWGLINLMPVYPLDGGQISRELFVVNNPRTGIQQSLWLSIFAAGGMAVASVVLLKGGGLFMALMFGSLAFGSFQILQQISGRGGGFGGGNPW